MVAMGGVVMGLFQRAQSQALVADSLLSKGRHITQSVQKSMSHCQECPCVRVVILQDTTTGNRSVWLTRATTTGAGGHKERTHILVPPRSSRTRERTLHLSAFNTEEMYLVSVALLVASEGREVIWTTQKEKGGKRGRYFQQSPFDRLRSGPPSAT